MTTALSFLVGRRYRRGSRRHQKSGCSLIPSPCLPPAWAPSLAELSRGRRESSTASPGRKYLIVGDVPLWLRKMAVVYARGRHPRLALGELQCGAGEVEPLHGPGGKRTMTEGGRARRWDGEGEEECAGSWKYCWLIDWEKLLLHGYYITSHLRQSQVVGWWPGNPSVGRDRAVAPL